MTKTLFSWDLNGTLFAEPATLNTAALQAVMDNHGIKRAVAGWETVSGGWDRIGILAPELGYNKEVVMEFQAHRERLLKLPEYRPAPFAGTKEALRRVKENRDDNILVSTVIGKDIYDILNQDPEIRSRIDAVYSAGDELFKDHPGRDPLTFSTLLPEYKARLIDGHFRKGQYGRVVLAGNKNRDFALGVEFGVPTTTFLIRAQGKADFIVQDPLDVVKTVYASA
ncbi:MAG: hypothetical protein HY362_00710 [Candidatus Aenigmarchaeota archaeon]|nr:hypothetical protein [Candidatus Aenigmarchaeota archaeon]